MTGFAAWRHQSVRIGSLWTSASALTQLWDFLDIPRCWPCRDAASRSRAIAPLLPARHVPAVPRELERGDDPAMNEACPPTHQKRKRTDPRSAAADRRARGEGDNRGKASAAVQSGERTRPPPRHRETCALRGLNARAIVKLINIYRATVPVFPPPSGSSGSHHFPSNRSRVSSPSGSCPDLPWTVRDTREAG